MMPEAGSLPSRQACAALLCAVAQDRHELDALVQGLPHSVREHIAATVIDHARDEDMDALLDTVVKQDHVRALGLAALSKHFGNDFRKEFEVLDENASGTISRGEFKRYLSRIAANDPASVPRPTNHQLRIFALHAAMPMVVFGILDNSIMILGGDVIDDMIGSTFRLSTLACAALANTFADVLGISIGNTVESMTARLGLPKAGLSHLQVELPIVRRVERGAASGGIFVGCILGMFPLLFKKGGDATPEK